MMVVIDLIDVQAICELAPPVEIIEVAQPAPIDMTRSGVWHVTGELTGVVSPVGQDLGCDLYVIAADEETAKAKAVAEWSSIGMTFVVDGVRELNELEVAEVEEEEIFI